MNYVQSAWILAAVVCSAFCWKVWPGERRRILAVWLLIALSLGFRAMAVPLNVSWLVEVANAFGQLAAIQFFAIVMFRVFVRRWAIHMIFGELVVGISYIVVVFRLLTRLGTDVNGLIATSTVVTAIIGLSMQDILMNSVGGLVLQLEGEIAPGDYIRTEHGSGWVRKVRTRYTAIETSDSDSTLIPNQLLNKGAVTIVSRSHRTAVGFHVPFDHLPTTVIAHAENALRTSTISGVAEDPQPVCTVAQFHPGHIEYRIYAWLTNPGHQSEETSAILLRVYFALSRAGIPFTGISQRVDLVTQQPLLTGSEDRSFSISNLRRNDVFRILTPEELELLAHRLKRVSFAPGETIVSQGDQGDSLYVVVKGRLRVVLSVNRERSEEVAILQAGSLFGEMSLLTGERRSASVIAAEQVDCDRLDKADFAEVLVQRPELADHMAQIMCERQISLVSAREKLSSAPMGVSAQTLLARIEAFFGIGGR